METKNEPKTLEEANYYESRDMCYLCDNCEHVEGTWCTYYVCKKFDHVVSCRGVCDCYE